MRQEHPPSTSNENPYSGAQFKTLKHCPAFPGRFDSIADERSFCAAFFDHYNHVHRHADIGLHTPASVHYGTATEIRAARAVTLNATCKANPRPIPGIDRPRRRSFPRLRESTNPTRKN